MKPYADTNFFTRQYLPMKESEVVLELIEAAAHSNAPSLPVSWFSRLEFYNALQLHVFQGREPGRMRITPEQASAAMAVFREDLTRGASLKPVALPTDDLERTFEELSLRHTARHGFRTYDLFHVASALLLSCDTFWSFDPKATRLAKLEGLHTLHV